MINPNKEHFVMMRTTQWSPVVISTCKGQITAIKTDFHTDLMPEQMPNYKGVFFLHSLLRMEHAHYAVTTVCRPITTA